jgi:hypothetical protein
MLKLILPMCIAMLTGCVGLPISPENTALDRLQSKAAEHAASLAGEDVAPMRETGLELLETLAAYAGR